jgi:hypothetical protein
VSTGAGPQEVFGSENGHFAYFASKPVTHRGFRTLQSVLDMWAGSTSSRSDALIISVKPMIWRTAKPTRIVMMMIVVRTDIRPDVEYCPPRSIK